MERIKELLAAVKRFFVTHEVTGAVHGDVQSLHELLTALVVHVEQLGKSAVTGVSAEFEALVKSIGDEVSVLRTHITALASSHEVMKDAIDNMSSRIQAVESHQLATQVYGKDAGEPPLASAATVADQAAASDREQAAPKPEHPAAAEAEDKKE